MIHRLCYSCRFTDYRGPGHVLLRRIPVLLRGNSGVYRNCDFTDDLWEIIQRCPFIDPVVHSCGKDYGARQDRRCADRLY